jgi:periplasmic protein TonB
MFDQTFVDGVGKTNKSWTVLISAVIQFAILAILIIIPLIFTDVLPQASLTSMLVAPAPPPPPPPPPPPQVVKVVKVAPRQFVSGQLTAPKTIPKTVAIITEAELPPATNDVVVGVVGGVGAPTGAPGGVLGGIPPPPPPPPPPRPRRLRLPSRWVRSA